MPHPHASLKILALADHKPFSAEELAKHLGKSPITVRHQISRLAKWGQIDVENQVQMVPTGRTNRRGKAIPIPVRTKIFRTTERGRARLEKKGGHARLCPQCGPSKPKVRRG